MARKIVMAAVAALALLAAAKAAVGNPNALWEIVHGKCVPQQEKPISPPTCAKVDISHGVDRGYALLKDNAPTKPYAYLLIPTTRITGIEDPRLLTGVMPNYFQDAWDSRDVMAKSLGFTPQWDMIALAINSKRDRTQNQFHIHVDCVRPDVRAELKADENRIGSTWTKIDFPPPHHPYMVMRLGADELAKVNPFELVSHSVPGGAEHMSLMTAALVGTILADGRQGFYLLASEGSATQSAHAEDLIDPTCKVAK